MEVPAESQEAVIPVAQPPTSTWDSTSCHFPKLDTCPGRQ